MNIDINLPLLKLNDVTLDNELLKHEDNFLKMYSNSSLQKILEAINTAKNIFFQDKISIDKNLLNQIGLDHYKMTTELSKILFDNVLYAEALRIYLECRYDEFYEYAESKEDGCTFILEINERYFDVYNEEQLIRAARENAYYNLNNRGMLEIIGDIEYIADYFDLIEVEKLVKDIKSTIKSNDSKVPDDVDINDNEDFIKWFAEEYEEIFFDTLEEYFDFDKAVKQWVSNDTEAVSEMEGFGSSIVWSGNTKLDGFKSQHLYVYERD